MINAPLLSLIQNTALLLAMALLFELSAVRWHAGKFRLIQIPIGLLLGSMGIILILTPWIMTPGIIFDTRSILLGISGLFFGTIPTLIAMVMTIIFRVYQGGAGVSMGIAVIISTGFSGLAWRHFRKKPLRNLSAWELYTFGVVIHIIMLLCGFFLPKGVAWQVISNIMLPVLTLYPIGTALLGLIFVNQIRRNQAKLNLIRNEIRLKSLAKILQFSTDKDDDLLTYTLQEAVNNTNSQIGFLYTCLDNSQECHLACQISAPTTSRELSAALALEWETLGLQHAAIQQNRLIWLKDNVNPRKTAVPANKTLSMIRDMIAVPVISDEKIVAVVGIANTLSVYEPADCTHLSLLMDAVWKIIERNKIQKSLSSIEWMLTKKLAPDYASTPTQSTSNLEITDQTDEGLILSSVGKDLLTDIANDYLDLLDTSAAIYEKDGKYALAVFSSSWCKFMDDTSRSLCQTDDHHEAMRSGKWLCHESCWTQTSKIAIETREPTDVECEGKLHIYAVPIFANEEVIGAINFGYGDPPKDRSTLEELAKKYQADVEKLSELAYAYESRPPFIVELAKQRLLNSANLIGTLIEKNQAQADLQRNESMLSKIFDILPIGLWFADKNGKLLRGNPAGVKIWGAEPLVDLSEYGVFKARFLPSRKEVEPDDWALAKAIQFGKTTEDELLEIETFDGTKKIILNYATPIINAKGEIEGAVVVNLDTTERVKAQEKAKAIQLELQHLLKEADQARQVLLSVVEDQKIAEEQISRLNQELEERVLNRTIQLEVANRELEAFAYSVSHDLRAPLRAMDGFSAALLEDYPDKLDEQGKHYLARIQEASRRMGQLIEDLLNLSRVTRREIVKETVNLSVIALEILEEYKNQSLTQNMDFIIEEQLLTLADPHLIRIVLENLINNACKFSSTKEKTIVQVGKLENTLETVFFVKDNGVGFNMDYINKLFNPFQRLHSIEEFPGTGIGLVTVQRIINRHGGRIWPEAILDQGATFYFTLGEKHEG
jgi:PAS domain S-box-containing protein